MDLIGSRKYWREKERIEIIRNIYSHKKILKNFKLKKLLLQQCPLHRKREQGHT